MQALLDNTSWDDIQKSLFPEWITDALRNKHARIHEKQSFEEDRELLAEVAELPTNTNFKKFSPRKKCLLGCLSMLLSLKPCDGYGYLRRDVPTVPLSWNDKAACEYPPGT